MIYGGLQIWQKLLGLSGRGINSISEYQLLRKMAERKRGIQRIPITEEEVPIFSGQLAGQIQETIGWQPNMIVGIDFGGAEIGQLVAEELKCSFASILVRRRFVALFDQAVARYPYVFASSGRLTQVVLGALYHVFDPVVMRPLERSIEDDQCLLLVDDSIGKGPTLKVARQHLIDRKAKPELIKTAVVQVHPEYSGPMPDYYCMVDNRRFPWDKASMVYEYIHGIRKNHWAKKRLP